MKNLAFIIITVLLLSCGGTADNYDIGDTAPDFNLEDSQENSYTLSSYKGQSPVIIYFYPKANTPGCTTEACGFRDNYSKFEENGIVVLGISVDTKEDIREFINDHNLNFPLLSDADKKVSEKYGVLNSIGVANRVTFIIDKEGRIAQILKDINVESHAEEVYDIAKKLL